MIRRRVNIHGQVQGVFFRDSCRREAAGRGVRGWIANNPDGSVEAVFEGEQGPVNEIVEWCRTGPPHARVVRVEVEEEPPEDLEGFQVRG
jgi:acylphosphatase